MSKPTFTRWCCGIAMTLRRRLANGNEIIECSHCHRCEEISPSGMSIPPTPTQTKGDPHV